MPETPNDKSDPLGIAVRQLLAIAGAFSILGLIRDLLTWQHDLGIWIDAIRVFTRPIATFLFGWIPDLLHLSFPGWIKDYLTVGVITVFAAVRLVSVDGIKKYSFGELLIIAAFGIILWPLFILFIAFGYFILGMDDSDRRLVKIFASVYIYAILIIALNYAFIFGGARTSG